MQLSTSICSVFPPFMKVAVICWELLLSCKSNFILLAKMCAVLERARIASARSFCSCTGCVRCEREETCVYYARMCSFSHFICISFNVLWLFLRARATTTILYSRAIQRFNWAEVEKYTLLLKNKNKQTKRHLELCSVFIFHMEKINIPGYQCAKLSSNIFLAY